MSNSSWMPGEKMILTLVESSWKMKNQICFITVWIFLSKGVVSQHRGYTLTAPAFVSVQRGLHVHIPCNFTYNKQHQNNFSTFYGYWFKNKKESFRCTSVRSQSNPGVLVTTNNEGQTIKESIKNRIQLDGDLEQGNCSFRINDAQLEDEGSYYFRVEQGDILKYSFYRNTLQVSVTDPPWPSSTQPPNCMHEDNALFCICSFQSQVPAQIQWQVEGETHSGNSTRGALQIMSWVHTNEVVSSLNFSGSLEGRQPLVCLGSNAFGIYAVHFWFSSPTKFAYVTILVSAVCGSLVTASIFLLGLCLSRLRKKQKEKEEKQKEEEKEASCNMRVHQDMDENSAIYYNLKYRA